MEVEKKSKLPELQTGQPVQFKMGIDVFLVNNLCVISSWTPGILNFYSLCKIFIWVQMFFLFYFGKPFLKVFWAKKINFVFPLKKTEGKVSCSWLCCTVPEECVPKTECTKESDKTLPRLCATWHHLTMCHPIHKTKALFWKPKTVNILY